MRVRYVPVRLLIWNVLAVSARTAPSEERVTLQQNDYSVASPSITRTVFIDKEQVDAE